MYRSLELKPEESADWVWIAEQHPGHRPPAQNADIAEPEATGPIHVKIANVVLLTMSQQSWDAKHV